jgi:MATE family multidrug resistance protein
MTNLMYVGHLGDASKVAGVGLGNMWANITCLLVVFGLNQGISTLASQAFGSGNLRKVGVYLNQGRFVIILAFIPISIIMCQAENFFTLIGIDQLTSHYA